jgi:hypothetical protein
VRSWKDADLGGCPSLDGTAGVPAHPVGRIDIDNRALDVTGAEVSQTTEYLETLGCCQGFTQAGKCDFTAGWMYCTMGCITIYWSHWDWCRP